MRPEKRPPEGQSEQGCRGREGCREATPTFAPSTIPERPRFTMSEVGVRQRRRKIHSIRKPVRGQLLQPFPQRSIHVPRDGSPDLGRRHWCTLNDLPQHSLSRAPHVRRVAREHLVEHRRQGIGIAGRAYLLIAGSLLRRHVIRRPERQPCLGQSIAARGTHRQCNAEIRHEWLASAE